MHDKYDLFAELRALRSQLEEVTRQRDSANSAYQELVGTYMERCLQLDAAAKRVSNLSEQLAEARTELTEAGKQLDIYRSI